MTSKIEGEEHPPYASTAGYRPRTTTPARLAIVVLFTGVDGTLAALRSAAALSSKLDPSIRLIGLEVVPYPLPASEPPRSIDFSRRRLAGLVAAAKVPARIEIYLCRDRTQALRQVFTAPSVVLVGGPKHWWGGPEQRLARWLEKQGHSAVFIPANAREMETCILAGILARAGSALRRALPQSGIAPLMPGASVRAAAHRFRT